MASSKAIVLFALFATVLLSTCRAAEEPRCGPEDIRVTTSMTGRVWPWRTRARRARRTAYVVLRCSPAAMAAAGALLDGANIRVVADRDGYGSKGGRGGDQQGLCLVGNGWRIAKGAPVTFTYAAEKPLEFSVYNSSPRCC